jgi:hypothetical protein
MERRKVMVAEESRSFFAAGDKGRQRVVAEQTLTRGRSMTRARGLQRLYSWFARSFASVALNTVADRGRQAHPGQVRFQPLACA